MTQHWKVGIVGGTGYTGAELFRLLLGHPSAVLHTITSRSEAGVAVADYFPSLRGYTSLKFSDPAEGLLQECDIVFFATPHGVAMKQAPQLLQHGVKIVDLSADFRLQNPQEWARWYGMEHTASHLLPEAIYGLPELHRTAIRTARLVANPGCYPTAVLLGFLPLLKAKNVAMDGLIADAKSGVSGAGRKTELPLMFAEAADSIAAYGVPGHRHLPEIVQQMSQVVNHKIGLTFVPHLMPMIRGMQATLYGTLLRGEVGTDLQGLYEKFYEDEPFVDVLPAGSHPTTRSVRAANMCRLAVHRPAHGDKVVVLSVIDNLVKGAAGQALQNMNLMMGAPEAAGLKNPAVLP